MKPFNGGRTVNNGLLHHFRNNILPEELRPTRRELGNGRSKL